MTLLDRAINRASTISFPKSSSKSSSEPEKTDLSLAIPSQTTESEHEHEQEQTPPGKLRKRDRIRRVFKEIPQPVKNVGYMLATCFVVVIVVPLLIADKILGFVLWAVWKILNNSVKLPLKFLCGLFSCL
ncbi:hypothetical protein BDV06DRAFT_224844 [Aspergillus oleicola]